MPDPTPVLSQEELQKVRYQYETGNFRSVSELARQYGVKPCTLHARIKTEGWDKKRDQILQKTSLKMEKEAVNEVDSWLKRVKERTLKDWEIIDRSIDNIGSEIDPETLLPFIRGRKLLDDMHRRAQGIADPTHNVDITSKGQSLGESLVSAIAKVRESESGLKITSQDVDRIIEAEIIEDDVK